jgi:hypothetical protein
MLPIPIDILQLILDHLDQASLAKICQVNKICCFYSQDVLYRDIGIDGDLRVCETLAQSTHLAERVRSFDIHTIGEQPKYRELLRKSLQNMTNLRSLVLYYPIDFSVLDECTFRLVSFCTENDQSGTSLGRFLHN